VDTKHLESGWVVITITGRLAPGGETEKLNAGFHTLLQKGRRKFVLAVTGLEYVDGSGVGTLVSCLTSAKTSSTKTSGRFPAPGPA
jgi:anti-anti-sigma regulatory factor